MTFQSHMYRATVAMTLVAVLAGPTVPLAARKAPPVVKAEDRNSPVRCNRLQPQYDYMGGSAQTKTGRRAPDGRMNVPPPPPPPPPLPPPSVGLPATVAPQVMMQEAATGASRTPYPTPYPYPQAQVEDRERYAGKDVTSIKSVAQEPVSTFSVDVDTGSYANVRRFLMQGQQVPAAAVRTEEMINYFRYDYAAPRDRTRPFSVTTDMANTPWNPDTKLLRVGIKGYDPGAGNRPATNLVFLVDVSGSMFSQDKLPLVKASLSMLADRLTPRDKVSIVVYAGAAGIVLEPTSNANHVKAALDCLQAGGSTAGGQGMELAYATARANFIRGGVNRVIMATDGDFNVGISSQDGIESIVKKNRESGITLTTLGFGQGNYNEAMMEKVADIGNGNYAYIDSTLEAQKVLDEEMEATLFTIAKDVKVQLEFNPSAVKEYRLIGYENRILAEEDFANDKVDAGDIGQGHQVTALYEIVPANGRGWLPDRRYPANRISPDDKPFAAMSELGMLKLRYKLPDGDRSMLIEKPLPVGMIAQARAPQGDMAFVCAVAAYGQKLRGDKYLGNFSFADVRRLAGNPNSYLRQEFVKLVSLADSPATRSPQDDF